MSRASLPLLLLLALACGRTDPAPPAAPAPARARVTIGLHVIDAEIADTPARQQKGLSGRLALAQGKGMVFVYDEPDLRGFWMPDMHFNLDIVWIRAGRIVHIEADVPHVVSGALPVYRPSEPADTVLEVAAGTAERFGWQVGDAVLIEAPAG